MKKTAILILLVILSANLYAQSSEIVATSYKQIFKTDGVWGNWPNHWTTYKSEKRSNRVVRITKISSRTSGHVYRLQMYIDNIVEADFYVKYDSEKSLKIRKQWNDEYVNCYKDVNGDYIFTQKVSLESISKDNSAWKTNEASHLYLMIYSKDYCVALR